MSLIQSIGRVEFGVRFVVCSNAEVIGWRTVGQDRTGNGWKEEAQQASSAACRVVEEAGFVCETESNFRAYNGGARQTLVDEVYYIAEIDEDGVRGNWVHTHAIDVPASVRKQAGAIGEKAHAALVTVMEDASKAQDAANAD